MMKFLLGSPFHAHFMGAAILLLSRDVNNLGPTRLQVGPRDFVQMKELQYLFMFFTR